MILTDDNFASIEAAVEEGRSVYQTLRKFIVWTLPTNGGQSLALLLAVLAGVPLPLQPVQLLWINMTTAILLGLMLAFEPVEAGLMNRPPRATRGSLLARTCWHASPWSPCCFPPVHLACFAGNSHWAPPMPRPGRS